MAHPTWDTEFYARKAKKKNFTAGHIVDDLEMCLVVLRLYGTGINFGWLSQNFDGVSSKRLTSICNKFKIIGFVQSVNITKVPEPTIEYLNRTMPMYWDNIDKKTPLVWIRTDELKDVCDEWLFDEMEEKWSHIQEFKIKCSQVQNEMRKKEEFMLWYKKQNEYSDVRYIRYPNGALVEKKTSRYWENQIRLQRAMKEITQEGGLKLLTCENPQQTNKKDNVRKMTQAEKEQRYMRRRLGVAEE